MIMENVMQVSGKFPPVTQTAMGERFRELAYRRYGHDNTAKKLARDAGVTPRTAEGWLCEGKAPHLDTFKNLIKAWGRDALLILFSPEIEDHAATIEREMQEAHALYLSLKAKRKALESLPSHQNPLADFSREKRAGQDQ